MHFILQYRIYAGTRVARIWRIRYLEALMYQDVEYYDVEQTPGGLLAALNEDTLNIESALGQKYGQFFQFLFMFISGLIIALVEAWQQGLVMFATVPALVCALGGTLVVSFSLQKRRNQLYEKADDIVQQYLTQIRTVVSYNAQNVVMDYFNEAVIPPHKVSNQQANYAGLGVGFIYLCIFGVNALGWW